MLINVYSPFVTVSHILCERTYPRQAYALRQGKLLLGLALVKRYDSALGDDIPFDGGIEFHPLRAQSQSQPVVERIDLKYIVIRLSLRRTWRIRSYVAEIIDPFVGALEHGRLGDTFSAIPLAVDEML
jgi:hypothetical protein